MDQPLRRNARLLFTVLFISQVCGTPIFWSQPDCYQNQYSEVPYESYQGPSYQDPIYQGPSYQETLQTMVAETLRAISEIVQITAKVTKQELASFSSVFQNPPVVNEDCNNSGGTDGVPDDFQFVSPQQPVKFPEQSMGGSFPYPIEPSNETPIIAELPIPLAADRNSSSTSQAAAVLDNKVGINGNSSVPSQPVNVTNQMVPKNTTGNMISISTLSQSAVNSSNVDEDASNPNTTTTTDGNLSLTTLQSYSSDDLDAIIFSTEQPNVESETQPENITRNNSSVLPSDSTGNMSSISTLSQSTSAEYSTLVDKDEEPVTSTVLNGDLSPTTIASYSSDDMDAIFFSTEKLSTETETVFSTETTGPSTSTSDISSTEKPTVISRKPKL